jgi:hypothetical protein
MIYGASPIWGVPRVPLQQRIKVPIMGYPLGMSKITSWFSKGK